MGEMRVTLPQCLESDFRLILDYQQGTMACCQKPVLKKLLRTKLGEVLLEAAQGYIYWWAEKKPDKEETRSKELILIHTENKPRDQCLPWDTFQCWYFGKGHEDH